MKAALEVTAKRQGHLRDPGVPVRAREAAEVGAPLCRLKADVFTTLGHPARQRVAAGMLTGSEPAAMEMLPLLRPDMGRSSAVPGVRPTACMDGLRRRGPAGRR